MFVRCTYYNTQGRRQERFSSVHFKQGPPQTPHVGSVPYPSSFFCCFLFLPFLGGGGRKKCSPFSVSQIWRMNFNPAADETMWQTPSLPFPSYFFCGNRKWASVRPSVRLRGGGGCLFFSSPKLRQIAVCLPTLKNEDSPSSSIRRGGICCEERCHPRCLMRRATIVLGEGGPLR